MIWNTCIGYYKAQWLSASTEKECKFFWLTVYSSIIFGVLRNNSFVRDGSQQEAIVHR